MSEEVKGYVDKIWNKEAKKQLENELSFILKEKIELPDDKDYLKIYAETRNIEDYSKEEMQQEINILNYKINKMDEYLHKMLNATTGKYHQAIQETIWFLNMLKEYKGEI